MSDDEAQDLADLGSQYRLLVCLDEFEEEGNELAFDEKVTDV